MALRRCLEGEISAILNSNTLCIHDLPVRMQGVWPGLVDLTPGCGFMAEPRAAKTPQIMWAERNVFT